MPCQFFYLTRATNVTLSFHFYMVTLNFVFLHFIYGRLALLFFLLLHFGQFVITNSSLLVSHLYNV